MTAAQRTIGENVRRLAVFAGLSFIVSCLGWLGLVWLQEFGLPFSRRVSYALIVILCGALAFAMKMWRREQGIVSNFCTSIVCFVMPAISLPLLAVTALSIACYAEQPCIDL